MSEKGDVGYNDRFITAERNVFTIERSDLDKGERVVIEGWKCGVSLLVMRGYVKLEMVGEMRGRDEVCLQFPGNPDLGSVTIRGIGVGTAVVDISVLNEG